MRLKEIISRPVFPGQRGLTAASAIERVRSEHLHLDRQISREMLAAELALRPFIYEAWPIIEPNSTFIPSYHIDAMADHLEALVSGQIRNLLINIPPRHSKSTIASVLWPVHTWTIAPAFRWLFGSYAQSLSIRDAVKSRRLIESAWFQERWGHRFQLTSDQNQKMRYDNDKSGYRIATGVGGSATGEGGDAVVADDPHNILERDSEAMTETVLDWWDTVMSTRLNDPKTGRKLIIMQRVTQDDLAAHVLQNGGYEHLCLPTEFDPKRICITSIGSDWRKVPGELLCPQRFGPLEVEKAKIDVGSDFQGLYNQDPQPAGGKMFQRAWFKIIEEEALPLPEEILGDVRFWDCAGTDAAEAHAKAYTCGLRLRRYSSGIFVVVDVVRGQWSTGVVDDTIYNTALADGIGVRIREEQEPGSAGKAVINSRRGRLAGFDFVGKTATGSKPQRARPLAVQAEAGKVRLLRAPWNMAFLSEYESFAAGSSKPKDQVDAGSGAFNEVALGGDWSCT